MIILIDGIEPQFKIYKMTECIENKFYIGKSKTPLKERMNHHMRNSLDCDKHFSNIGWNNVTVEIIEACYDENDMNKKEKFHIQKYFNSDFDKILNLKC